MGAIIPSATPKQFPRIRIVSQFSGIQSAVGNYTDGVTQLSESSRIGIPINTLCTDISFLVYNGNFSLAPPAPTGNAFMLKAALEYQGNSIPISFPSNAGQQMATPAQTTGTGITTTVTTGASSATQTVGSTTNYQVGATLNFATAGVNAVIQSITSSTVVVLTNSISTTTGENVTIVGYQGSGTMLGDGQAMFSTPLGGLYTTVGYKWRHYRQCSPGSQMPYTGQQGNGPSGQNFNGNISTSDVVNGSTCTDGADYTTTIGNTMGSLGSNKYAWSPLAVIGRQINEIPVTLITGDSVGFGFGSTYFQGYLGLACANAGVAYYNCGISGITGINQERYDGILQKLSRYVDYVLMQIGTNDINSASGNAWFFTTGQAMFLAEAQTFTGGIGTIFFSMVPQRTTSSNWSNYTGQTVLSTEPLRVQINNAFRDTSANGMAAYFAANISSPATVGAPNDVWVASGMERTSAGGLVSLNATTYNFTTSSATVAYLDVYTDTNGQSYTVGPALTAGTQLCVTSLGSNAAPASGVLTKFSGAAGSSGTINYSAVTQSSSNQQMFGVGGYWLTNGTNNEYTADGIHPNGNAIPILAPLVNVAPLEVLPSSTSGAYNTNTLG